MKTTLEVLPTIVFVVVMLCWVAFAAVFIFRQQPKAPDQKRDRASIPGVALQALSYAIVWSIHRPFFSALVAGVEWLELMAAIVAIVAAIGSVLLVRSAVKMLGKEWSITARMVQDHKLATRGPYAYVRHPIYTGMLGMLVATGLATSHWIVLVAAIVVFAIGTWIRVRIEERLLRETFGTQFEEYARRVPAVIPRIF
ncbi:MAG TPA: isoprenylcysteine carboxylmethyltransferase family protein [Pyrinomonadaceae bacterium]|jgi:protein-S-isoprenylcysteine O-methyltransferase Ste14|nr:isoprenylcysteine carboxylmethyltransferase family protein [Pyrinomonadaceae bacterium]